MERIATAIMSRNSKDNSATKIYSYDSSAGKITIEWLGLVS